MKAKSLLLLSLINLSTVFAQQSAIQRAQKLITTRYPAQITFRIITDEGKPAAGVVVGASTFHHWVPGEGFGKDISETKTEKTNEQGNITLSMESLNGRFGYSVSDSPGYYRDNGNQYQFEKVKDGKWQPWNPIIDVVLKPIINPIPMYARHVNLAIPVFNTPLGFDLEVGDWVAPQGRGAKTDMIFTAKLDKRSAMDFDYMLTVSFPNKLDGIQMFEVPTRYTSSEFCSPRYAPEEDYKIQWIQTRTRRPDSAESGNYAIDSNRNYFIRVRTSLDETGKVKSANYGKIYGDFMNFTYYLNPTSNDRNMEFDPKKNLFRELPSDQRVNIP